MASDIAIAAEEILKTRERLNQLYSEHTGSALSKVERVMDRDTWFDAQQAKEFGVIDGIIEKRK
jgi:ATP-dependent Clp protease, protease subunit